jgi:DNA ligase-1
VKRQDANELWQGIKYCIFDVPIDGMPFEQRLQKAKDWFAEHPSPYVEILEQIPCTGPEHLQDELAKELALGGEGMMLRTPGSMYEHRRSGVLLKVKEMDDDDAIVRGYTKGEGKYNVTGMIGALDAELPSGMHVSVGSGLTDADRAHPPAIGSIITIKHQGFTDEGSLRFPIFQRVRTDVTWDDVIRDAGKAKTPSTPKAKRTSKPRAKPTGPVPIPTPNPHQTGPQLIPDPVPGSFSVRPLPDPENAPILDTYGYPITPTLKSSVPSSSPMEHYEYNNNDQNSHKFWEISQEGCNINVSYGRIGASAKPKTTTFASEEEAIKYADKKRKEKLKEGYQLK